MTKAYQTESIIILGGTIKNQQPYFSKKSILHNLHLIHTQ